MSRSQTEILRQAFDLDPSLEGFGLGSEDIVARSGIESLQLALHSCARCFINRPSHLQHRVLYVWGPVGTGKTMCMDFFVQHYKAMSSTIAVDNPDRILRVHFHDLLSSVHAALHAFRLARRKLRRHDTTIRLDSEQNVSPVQALVRRAARNIDVLCIDEFQVSDVADAMLLKDLIGAAMDAGIGLVVSSNRPPQELYQDGLNRELLLPFLHRLESESTIVLLDALPDPASDVQLSGEQGPAKASGSSQQGYTRTSETEDTGGRGKGSIDYRMYGTPVHGVIDVLDLEGPTRTTTTSVPDRPSALPLWTYSSKLQGLSMLKETGRTAEGRAEMLHSWETRTTALQELHARRWTACALFEDGWNAHDVSVFMNSHRKSGESMSHQVDEVDCDSAYGSKGEGRSTKGRQPQGDTYLDQFPQEVPDCVQAVSDGPASAVSGFGRKVLVQASHVSRQGQKKLPGAADHQLGLAWSTFSHLCQQPLGAADYRALCQHYHTIGIAGVPRLGLGNMDAARRFLTLVDVAYDAGIRLLLATAVPPGSLFAELGTSSHSVGSKNGTESEKGHEITVGAHGGSSSGRHTTILAGGIEWSATGRQGASLAKEGAVSDLIFSHRRAHSRLIGMASREYWSESKTRFGLVGPVIPWEELTIDTQNLREANIGDWRAGRS